MPNKSQLDELKKILSEHTNDVLSQEHYILVKTNDHSRNLEVAMIAVKFKEYLDSNNLSATTPPTEEEFAQLRASGIGEKISSWETETGEQIEALRKPASESLIDSVGSLLSRVLPSFLRHLTEREVTDSHKQLPPPYFFTPRDSLLRHAVQRPRFISPYLDALPRDINDNNVLHDILLPDYETQLAPGEKNDTIEISPNPSISKVKKEKLKLILQSMTDSSDFFNKMYQSAWGNTPLLLAIKLGQFELCEQLIEKASQCLREEQLKKICEARDTRGLMALSYALALRAPIKIIKFLLKNTSKTAYFTDNRWMEQAEHRYPSYEINITENGYFHGDIKLFELYALSPEALYTFPMPSQIRVQNAQGHPVLADSQHINIYEATKGSAAQTHTPFSQIFRNLIFHFRALCENEGLPITRRKNELNSGITASFDCIHNYPRFVECRNDEARISPQVIELLRVWMSEPIAQPASMMTSISLNSLF